MERWGLGINSYHKTAHIWCDVAPFYIFWLDDIMTAICGYLILSIPFPRIPLRLKDDEMEDNDDKRWTTWRDWYGDLSQWFHLYMHIPIFDFCNKCEKHYWLEVPYRKTRKIFYEMDKDYWDEEEQQAKEMKQEDKAKK